MNTTITLDELHFKTLADKARAIGQTPEQYLQALIDADNQTFDQILGPVRDGFDSMDDDEVDALFDRARKAARQGE